MTVKHKRKLPINALVFSLSAIAFVGVIFAIIWFWSGKQLWSGKQTELNANSALESVIPPYSGQPYAVVNNGIPFFTKEDLTTDSFENYSELDSLGRCRVAFANISRELMPTDSRGEIGDIKPTGWKQAKYEGIVDSDPPYLYNRCHLIAYCLAAEDANERNLITGTRYMNTVGMLPFEEAVVHYLDEYDHHILYRVTPVFDGNNLVANGVLMEAYSVEDKGAGICFCAFVYNVQPGIEIDYRTGESKKDHG